MDKNINKKIRCNVEEVMDRPPIGGDATCRIDGNFRQ